MSDPRGDTICALATPPGRSGIAVVRVSGPGSREILARHLARHRPRAEDPAQAPTPIAPTPRQATHGIFLDARGAAVDEIIAVLYPQPASYTGEDVLELSCHGSMQVVEEILEALMASGARGAEPGEFTRRAFLNGKMDLTQAEAVCDLIEARSALARRAALAGLAGRLGARIRGAASDLLDLLADVEASIDFVEEDLELVARGDLAERVDRALGELEDLRATACRGRRLRSGIRVPLVGAPNVGKSSLYNRILGEERAIVTPVPGTTRDRLREAITLAGYPLVLEDTAGVRADPGWVEGIGVEGARESIRESDVLLFVLDGSRAIGERDLHAWQGVDPGKTFVLVNKCDLARVVSEQEAGAALTGAGRARILSVSARDGRGLDELHRRLVEFLGEDEAGTAAGIRVSVNARQEAKLGESAAVLRDLLAGIAGMEPPEVLALELRTALEPLEEITGERITDDVLGRIFERFCVGK